jgi:serine/threonine-protein kinase
MDEHRDSTPNGTEQAPSEEADALGPSPISDDDVVDTAANVAAFAGIIVAGAVFALFAAYWLTARGQTEVPSVTGMGTQTAAVALAASDLSTGTQASVASTWFAPGIVMLQDPAAHQNVPVGTPVDLTVSVQPTPVTVPDVSLDSQTYADQVLSYALLRPIFYLQLSDTVPYGRVVAQLPRAGQQAMTGAPVAVFVSAGLGSGGVVVPNVMGKQASAASGAVADVHAVPVWFDLAPGEQPQGTIVDQVPAPGSRVPVGSAVPLFTSAN